MKHLKTYKIFESNNQITFFDNTGKIIYVGKDNKEVLNNIEEIFREISDIGFRVEYNRGGVDELLKIYIEKPMAAELVEFSAANLTFRKEFKYYPTVEFINSFLHLISYTKESNIDYRIEVIDDSQVIDVLYTESEIENIINWKNPIDYIKVIISEKEIVS